MQKGRGVKEAMELQFKSGLAVVICCVVLAAQEPTGQPGADPEQQFERGMRYHSGVGVNRSDQQALDLIRKAAERGHAPAQTVLGFFYESGTLVPRGLQQAAVWYQKAAEQGDPVAQWVLGRMYWTGQGVGRDSQQAERWLQKAASQGDAFGAYLLGVVKDERDYRSAPEWYRNAAERGLPQAQRRLGQVLKEGRALAQDKQEAYVWLFLSFEAGNTEAAPDLQQLDGELGSEQVDEAKARARKLQEEVSRSVVAKGCTGWAGEFAAIPSTPPPNVQKFCR
ncbi:MAG: tetratricopeptide repeat protein [Terriglobales bacterium]